MVIAIGIVAGGLITIVTAAFIEWLRMPRLSLSIEDPPLDVQYDPLLKTPAAKVRHLRLVLRNAPLWSVMQRSAALQCRGEIRFHRLDDGQDVFGKAMTVRWASSPQPILSQIRDRQTGEVRFDIVDFVRAAMKPRADVFPGEEEILDVAARFDDEEVCYGWNDDAYQYKWRNPDWKLVPGLYLVRVVVTSSGRQCVGVFRLINNVARSAFRLEPALKDDLPRFG